MNIVSQVRHKLGIMIYNRRRRLWGHLKEKFRELEVKTRQGRFVVSTRDDAIGGQLYSARRFELSEMEKVTEFLRREGLLLPSQKSFLIDIGANMGVICVGMLYRQLFDKAIAIEAEPYNFELLRRNVDLNGFGSSIDCVHCAVSSQDGFAKMRIDSSTVFSNMGDHRVVSTSTSGELSESEGYVMVPTRRLDDIVLEYLGGRMPEPCECLMWMDIQAHEGFALEGAGKLNASGHPLYVEVWPWGLDEWGGGAQRFINQVQQTWSQFIWFEDSGEQRHPIAELPEAFRRIGHDEAKYTNLLLIRP